MDGTWHQTIKEKAYFIGLFKDRMRIKHTQEQDWLEAEQELKMIEGLTSGIFEVRRDNLG